MPKEQKSPARSKFYTRIGAQGWRQSGYDTFTYDSPFFRRWIATQLAAKRIEILSIGCGAGELEHELTASGHAVTGLDLSHPMLKRAARKGLDRLVQADARALPFAAARFDLVMIMESIGYLELDAVFKEARRVLRKRGRFLITSYGASVDAHTRYRKWTMADIAHHLANAGFRIDEQRFLDVKKRSVRDAPAEEQAGLLYVSSRVNNRRARARGARLA